MKKYTSYNGKALTYNNRDKNDKIIFSENGSIIVRNDNEFKVYHKNNGRDSDYDGLDYVLVFAYSLMSKEFNRFINKESSNEQVILFVKNELNHIL